MGLNLEKSPQRKRELNSRSAVFEADALTTRPTRWSGVGRGKYRQYKSEMYILIIWNELLLTCTQWLTDGRIE